MIKDKDLITISSDEAGILYQLKNSGDTIKEGDTLAKILDPFTGETRSVIHSSSAGTIFFSHTQPLVHQNTILFKIAAY
jgi:predicted deacylase